MKPEKPLGRKGYGSIGHIPQSRTGPADHYMNEGQIRIACEQKRDRHDDIILTEKLDGSNCSVIKKDGAILTINRAGYPANTSPYAMHRYFAQWARAREDVFQAVLQEGEQLAGEWLIQAHGTRYDIKSEDALFCAFNLFLDNGKRASYDLFLERIEGTLIHKAPLLHRGEAISLEDGLSLLGEYGHYGALDKAEGLVWYVERKGQVDFLCKYVDAKKIDGRYLPEISGGEAIWHWPIDTYD